MTTSDYAELGTWLHGIERTGPRSLRIVDDEPLRLYQDVGHADRAHALHPGAGVTERVALVTGAAGGIGSAIAARLARDGFRVACSDRAAADAERAASAIAGAAGFGCDLRSEHAVAELCDAVFAELGAPWLLVNAAGVFFEHEVTELSVEQWDHVMDVNVRGTFLTCRALLPAMQDAGSGCIVNIASTAGLSGGHTRAAYNASKGAVVLFTRSLAIDCGPRGVRVNCVCPGPHRHADGRLDPPRRRAARGLRALAARRSGSARPEDVADAVVLPGLRRRVVPARQYAGRRWRGHGLSTDLAGEGLVTGVHNQFAWCAWVARSGRARSPAACGARGRSSATASKCASCPTARCAWRPCCHGTAFCSAADSATRRRSSPRTSMCS